MQLIIEILWVTFMKLWDILFIYIIEFGLRSKYILSSYIEIGNLKCAHIARRSL